MQTNEINQIRFTVDIDGAQKVFTLVDYEYVDPKKGYISWDAPLARAIVNSRVGDVVRAILPSGDQLKIKILQIEWWG